MNYPAIRRALGQPAASPPPVIGEDLNRKMDALRRILLAETRKWAFYCRWLGYLEATQTFAGHDPSGAGPSREEMLAEQQRLQEEIERLQNESAKRARQKAKEEANVPPLFKATARRMAQLEHIKDFGCPIERLRGQWAFWSERLSGLEAFKKPDERILELLALAAEFQDSEDDPQRQAELQARIQQLAGELERDGIDTTDLFGFEPEEISRRRDLKARRRLLTASGRRPVTLIRIPELPRTS